MEGTFSELHFVHPHKNISNFKKNILRVSEAYRQDTREERITEEGKKDPMTEDPLS